MKKIILLLMAINFSLSAQQTDIVPLSVNNVHIGIANNGMIGDLLTDKNQFDGHIILYSTGFYLSGYNDTTLWANGAFLSATGVRDYLPGKVGMDPNDIRNKNYVVRSDDSAFGLSWQKWKTAVELGAKFYDGNNDGMYNPVDLNNNGKWDLNEDKPDLLGDITIWSVFNDATAPSIRRFSDVQPQGIQIKQTAFAYFPSNLDELSNVFFIRYEIENTGSVADRFDSVYFSIVSDPDIGDYTIDLTGCDTLFNTGYAYKNGSDRDFGVNPPAIFINLLQSPYEFIQGVSFTDINNNGIYDDGIDIALDSAIIKRGPLLGELKIPGARNLGMSSYFSLFKSVAGLGDPYNRFEVRNFLTGGLSSDGTPIRVADFNYGNGASLGSFADSISTKYLFSGDPVQASGWLQIVRFDMRTMVNSGTFTLRKGKPVELIAAFIVGRGTDALNSITVARQINQKVINLYNKNFTDIPVKVERENDKVLPTEFSLSQNYPNPFNPSTNINFSIPEASFVNLKIFDVLGKEVAILVNERLNAGNYNYNFNANGLPSGVYFYRLRAGSFVSTKKMILMR